MAAPSAVPISFNATASSYIAHVRLPQSLMQKLEAEGASDMSISLSEGVLSVGGESYQLDAVPEEGSFDVVREHGSKMCNVGAVRERIHIKQTLSSAGRAQIKQRTEQGERDAHGHQTASVDAPPAAAKRKTPPASKQAPKPSQQQRVKSARPLSTSPPGGAPSGTMTAPTGRTGSTSGLDDLRKWCASRPPRVRSHSPSPSPRPPAHSEAPTLAPSAGVQVRARAGARSPLAQLARAAAAAGPARVAAVAPAPEGPFAGAAPRAAPRAPRRTPRRAPRRAPHRVASARGARDGGAVLAPAPLPLPTPPPPPAFRLLTSAKTARGTTCTIATMPRRAQHGGATRRSSGARCAPCSQAGASSPRQARRRAGAPRAAVATARPRLRARSSSLMRRRTASRRG